MFAHFSSPQSYKTLVGVEFLNQKNCFSFSDVNVAVRKIANLLKPDKEILQNGDHMIIKTLSTFRNYIMEFDVGKEFEEDLAGVDDRKCMVRIRTVTTDSQENGAV